MNVLTIDFDIIMAPSIEIYNNVINGNWGVNDMIEQNPLLQHLDADFEIYQKLTNYLYKITPKIDKNEIYFIHSHEEIIKYLPISNDVTIYNIDHHHDITYGPTEDKILHGEIGCGNWGKYLLDNDMIQDFVWIHNFNSVPPSEELMEKYPFDDATCILDENSLENIPIPDKIIICASWGWTPEKFAPLLYLWMDILGKIKRYNYKFEN